jgi:hypothetical protein
LIIVEIDGTDKPLYRKPGEVVDRTYSHQGKVMHQGEIKPPDYARPGDLK